MITENNTAKVNYLTRDFDISDIYDPAWERAAVVQIDRYWSGVEAPEGRRAKVRLLWSDNALYVAFVADQTEPYVISAAPNVRHKTLDLWDRDVCEIFVAPDPGRLTKYFEFEVAPTGEWVDLGIEVFSDKRSRDDAYHSGMQSIARRERGQYVVIMRIEWRAFGRFPNAGDIWRGNLFRCVGKDPDRGYLAWQPTLTEEPSFHVPERFGHFIFTR